MTEKRFTVHTLIEDYDVGEDDLKGHMIEILDNGNHMTYRKCCDLLNEQHEQLEMVKLLADQRGEIIAFANSLIQDLEGETEKEMWETFKEEMYQKWKKERRIE